MDDEDRPRSGSPISRGNTFADPDLGAASLLAGESLDRYSLDELDARIALLEAEVARIAAHRSRSASHMQAAHALFGARPSGRQT